ncbi:hypothetical protein QYF36_003209 [Acer negundo]|nr:hypothetical protein QYF36_003209 [Acer negundo]
MWEEFQSQMQNRNEEVAKRRWKATMNDPGSIDVPTRWLLPFGQLTDKDVEMVSCYCDEDVAVASCRDGESGWKLL